MKKIMMMAMMAVAATTAFAQDALVKESKKLLGKGDFDGAAKMLAPALQSNETVDKAAAWNLMSEIKYKEYEKINEVQIKSAISHETFDTLTMWRSAVEAWEYAQKCDEFDQLPDAKGKVKPKYRSTTQSRYKVFGPQLVQAGEYYRLNRKDYPNALKAYQAYFDLHKSPIFADVKDMQKEQFYYDIAYIAAFISYQSKEYEKAMAYANLAKEDPTRVDDANEILLFAKKDNCKTREDSLAYRDQLKELHKASPENERYFNLLVDYYGHSFDENGKADKLAWLQEELTINPSNKMPAALLGETNMNDGNMEEAIKYFEKAVEIDPSFTLCHFNLGVCYYNAASNLQDKLANKDGSISNANKEKVTALVKKAETSFLKAKELDPNQEQCKWAYRLSNVYNYLGDKAKEKEMDALAQ